MSRHSLAHKALGYFLSGVRVHISQPVSFTEGWEIAERWDDREAEDGKLHSSGEEGEKIRVDKGEGFGCWTEGQLR